MVDDALSLVCYGVELICRQQVPFIHGRIQPGIDLAKQFVYLVDVLRQGFLGVHRHGIGLGLGDQRPAHHLGKHIVQDIGEMGSLNLGSRRYRHGSHLPSSYPHPNPPVHLDGILVVAPAFVIWHGAHIAQ